jgi:hypothetical protein
MKDTIAKIAKFYLYIDTLEQQGSDRLDFHDCGVWGIRRALEAAYAAGAASGTPADVVETGDKLIAAMTGTICGDENVFKKFRAAFNRMKKARPPDVS